MFVSFGNRPNQITEEEAKIALSLKPYPEPVAVVAERINRDGSELGRILCKALAFITKHDIPGLIAQSNYYAAVDADTCEGCETCTGQGFERRDPRYIFSNEG